MSAVSITLRTNPAPFPFLASDRSGSFRPEFDVTTTACLSYLLADEDGDEAAKRDAFNHLIAIMLTATTGLFIPETVRSPTDKTAKYLFIEDFLLLELSPWRGRTLDEIDKAACNDKFRHLGHRCHQRVLNKIRDTRTANRRMQTVSYDDAWEEHQPEERPQPFGPEEFEAILSLCDFLAPQSLETATLLFNFAQDSELDRSKWAGALAVRRGVSVQMARKYIRNLREQTDAAIKAGHPAAQELYERFIPYIFTVETKRPDAPFSEDARNHGSIQAVNPETGKPIQFDSYFRQRPHQDPDYCEGSVAAWNPFPTTLTRRGMQRSRDRWDRMVQ